MLNLPLPLMTQLPCSLSASAMPSTPVAMAPQGGEQAPIDPQVADFSAVFTAAANRSAAAAPVGASPPDISGAMPVMAGQYSSILEEIGKADIPLLPSASAVCSDLPNSATSDDAETEQVPEEAGSLIAQIPPLREPIAPLPTPRREAAEVAIADAMPHRPAPAVQAPINMIAAADFQPVTVPVIDTQITRPAYAQFTLDLARSDWVATMSMQIESAPRDRHDLSVRLTPAHLGVVDLAIADTARGLIIDLRPSSDDAAQIFAREEPRLLEELRQRGVPVAEYILRNGVSDDGRGRQSGANADGFRPYQQADRFAIEDQDRESVTAESGRFA